MRSSRSEIEAAMRRLQFSPNKTKISDLMVKGNRPPVPSYNKSITCGDIDDGHTSYFLGVAAELVPGVIAGGTTLTGRRRIVATAGYEMQVRELINQWNKEKQEKADRPVIWACGMTTVSPRYESLISTITSLSNGGFDTPTIFVDGPVVDGLYNGFDVVFRGSNIKTYPHWLLSVIELYCRNPEADMFAMFQDDFIICKNTRQYLEKCVLPSNSYLNLFTFMKKNEEIIANMKTNGWIESKQNGYGGLALIFTNDALIKLMSQSHMYIRMLDKVRRYKYMDGAVVTAMNKAGIKEFIHNPSLVQHTGEISSMGNGSKDGNKWGHSDSHPSALTFPGEDFDALNFLV